MTNNETAKFRDIVYDVLAFKANEKIDSEKQILCKKLEILPGTNDRTHRILEKEKWVF